MLRGGVRPKLNCFNLSIFNIYGGGGGIRTHGRLSPTSVFKTGAFNHSATPPTRHGLFLFVDLIKGVGEKNAKRNLDYLLTI